MNLRLGLVGAGVIAGRHLTALEALSGIELVGIADPDPRAGQIAEARGVRLFADTAQLMTETRPDGVIVCTPTEHHLDPTLTALHAGAHVLVEKPISATLDEATQIIAASKATGRHVLVGHQRRYYAQVEAGREIVQGGTLGQLVAVSGQWAVRKPADYYNPDWRKRWQAGPVVTNLIHDMDSIRYICGEVESISAETSNSVAGWEKEDIAALVIRFESGALGSFVLSDQACSPWSWEAALGENISIPQSSQNALRFMGRDASLEFPNLVLWKPDAAPHDWTQRLISEAMRMPVDDPYIAQLRHFGEVIRGDAVPRVDAGDAMRSLAATVAVLEAAQSGQRVLLSN